MALVTESLSRECAASPAVRLFGPDRAEIVDLCSWYSHAKPEKGLAQWKDGYSAKEQANAWLRPGSPAMPEEIRSVITGFVDGDVDECYGRPEHTTKLDNYSRARQHDLLGCVRRNGATVLVVGVEAKACESFDGIVADRATATAPSKQRARCNLLSRALFGRKVLDEETGAILDENLSRHGYQLWTAAVGTVIEAQKRGMAEALVLVHQFVPHDIGAAGATGDKRDWGSALRVNAEVFAAFASELQAAGSRSHQTEFVQAGTTLHVVKVESTIAD